MIESIAAVRLPSGGRPAMRTAGFGSAEIENTIPPVEPLTTKHFTVSQPARQLPPDAATNPFSPAGNVDKLSDSDRSWAPSGFSWDASTLCHRPLYFQDVNLERYGLSFGLVQPAVSTAHAFGRFLTLPYMMTVQPPRRSVFSLGDHRPGTCMPYQRLRIPVTPTAIWNVGKVAAY